MDVKKARLITDNAELLLYVEGKLHLTILGGIRLTGLDRMKVTLKLIRTDNKNNAFRHNLDLYNSIQTEQLIEKASEALDVNTSEISTVLSNLTTALENYRAERLEAMKPKQPEKRQLTETERKAAIAYLKAPDLIGRTKQAIAASGGHRRGNQCADRLPGVHEQEPAHTTAFDVPGCLRHR
jgi:hypothetical protein